MHTNVIVLALLNRTHYSIIKIQLMKKIITPKNTNVQTLAMVSGYVAIVLLLSYLSFHL
jgi:hypothetical protein